MRRHQSVSAVNGKSSALRPSSISLSSFLPSDGPSTQTAKTCCYTVGVGATSPRGVAAPPIYFSRDTVFPTTRTMSAILLSFKRCCAEPLRCSTSKPPEYRNSRRKQKPSHERNKGDTIQFYMQVPKETCLCDPAATRWRAFIAHAIGGVERTSTTISQRLPTITNASPMVRWVVPRYGHVHERTRSACCRPRI